MNILTKTTELAMLITSKYINSGDFVIDATCGNGHDCMNLIERVGPSGTVLAIDIQEKALENARSNVTASGLPLPHFKNGNFVNIKEYAHEIMPGVGPRAVLFNLGYLPGGDKDITTKESDSLTAVKEALDLIEIGGIVTVVLYSGHPEGALEKTKILEWANSLSSSKYHAVYTKMENQHKNPPEILFITKKK